MLIKYSTFTVPFLWNTTCEWFRRLAGHFGVVSVRHHYSVEGARLQVRHRVGSVLCRQFTTVHDCVASSHDCQIQFDATHSLTVDVLLVYLSIIMITYTLFCNGENILFYQSKGVKGLLNLEIERSPCYGSATTI